VRFQLLRSLSACRSSATGDRPWRCACWVSHRLKPIRGHRALVRTDPCPKPGEASRRPGAAAPHGARSERLRGLRMLPGHPEPALSWRTGFRGGAHARPKAAPVHRAARRRGGVAASGIGTWVSSTGPRLIIICPIPKTTRKAPSGVRTSSRATNGIAAFAVTASSIRRWYANTLLMSTTIQRRLVRRQP
jgi:hypothetical protein